MDMTGNMDIHIVKRQLIAAVLLSLLTYHVHGQCPVGTNISHCTCTYKNDSGHIIPRFINCTGLQDSTLVSFVETQDIFQDFEITKSTITKLRPYMFQNLKARNFGLSDIGVENIDINAFLGSEAYTESLDLSNNKISSLPAGVFSYSGLLRIVDISNNQLSTINKDMFKGLSQITYLDLGHNKLNGISAESFRDMPMLQTLLLDENGLTKLDGGSFSGLTNLQVLHLSSNNISEISEHAFSDLTNLKQLYLSFNELPTFPENILTNKDKLEELTLNENNLELIPENLLFPVKNLRFLDVSYNNINHLDNFPFKKLEKLEKLYLQSNSIQSLYTNVFEDLHSVTEINVAHNDIDELLINCLVGLTNARHVKLDNNRISIIPYGLFDAIGNVAHLNLSYNLIDNFDDSEPFLANGMLEDLDLSWNQLRSVSLSMFRKTLVLKTLALSHNHIRKLHPESFIQLKKLETLDLSHNRINQPPGLMFVNNEKLHRLKLSWNPLHTVPHTLLTGLVALTELHLENACLDDLPDNFFLPPNDHLNLTDLTRPFYEPFTSLTKLQVLHLNGNFLEKLTYSQLQGAPLSEINVQENNISNLDSRIFKNMVSLSHVNISWNNLASVFSYVLDSMSNVTVLDLSYNQLETVDRGVLELDTDFHELYLRGNPFNCYCDSAFLRMYEPLQDYDRFLCSSGNDLVICFKEGGGCPKWPASPYYDTVCNYTYSYMQQLLTDQRNVTNKYVASRNVFRDFCVVTDEVIASTTPAPKGSSNRTLSFAPPQIVAISTDPSEPSLTRVQWSHKDTSLVAGYLLRYRQFASNDTIFSELVDNRFWYIFNISDINRENYIICVDVVLLDGEVVRDEDQCQEVRVVHTTVTAKMTTEESKGNLASDRPQLLLPIVLAAAVAVAIIILVIIGVRISLRRKRHRDRQQEAMTPEQKMSMWDFSYRGNVNEEMVEQTTLPYDVFDTAIIVDPHYNPKASQKDPEAHDANNTNTMNKKKSKRVKRRKTNESRKPSVLEAMDAGNRNSLENIDNDLFTSSEQILPPSYEGHGSVHDSNRPDVISSITVNGDLNAQQE